MPIMKCPVCNRAFVNSRACQQHERDKHRASMAPRARPQRNRRARVRGGGRVSAVDINPSRAGSAPGQTVTLVGEDRLGYFLVAAGTAPVLSFPIGVGMSARLSAVGKAFQRVRWDRISVNVVPQVSVVTNGGYVAGFVMDPSDDLVDAIQLTSNENSQTKKWFETANCVMPRKPDLLYTSAGPDPRLSQPAVFWVIGEGPPQNPVPAILTVKWKVTFSEPTVEAHTDKSFTIEGELLPYDGNYNLQYRKTPNSALQDDVSQVFPENVRGDAEAWYRVPTFIVEYAEGSGDTGTKQMHFIVYDGRDKKAYYGASYGVLDRTVWQPAVSKNVSIPDGTYMKYVGPGNAARGVAMSPPQCELSPLENCINLLTRATLLQERRMSSSTTSLNRSESGFEILKNQ